MVRDSKLCELLAAAIPALLIAAAVTKSFTRATTRRQALIRLAYVWLIPAGFACALAGATATKPGVWQVYGALVGGFFGLAATVGGLIDTWIETVTVGLSAPRKRFARGTIQTVIMLSLLLTLFLVHP